MKIRSLLLGSVAAAGLSTGGAFAADLGVLTSLDVCDNLGLSGLTISSESNCLQITGEVKYKFTWGDYSYDEVYIPTHDDDGNYATFGGDGYNDWESRFDAWIKFVATASTDFGPAKAVLKLKQVDDKVYTGGEYTFYDSTLSETVLGEGYTAYGGSTTNGVVLDEAYVSIGDSTVIMAGKKGSIMNKGDDEPLNWLGLFNSEDVDKGVAWGVNLPDGGHVIQVQSDLGNGVSVAAGLENLDGSSVYDYQDDLPGTAVGVITYAGEGLSAHLTVAAGGVLDGSVENWGAHAGFTGTFDNFKVVLAGAFGSHDAYDDYYDYTSWNVLASASATFDMFTLAGSVEAAAFDGDDYYGDTSFGAGASLSAAVADGVTLNVGGRWYHDGEYDVDGYQVAASVAAAVTETLTLTGEIGYLSADYNPGDDSAFYGSAELAWAPGGGYTSSVKGTVTSPEDGDTGYKIESTFKKTFE